MASLPKSLGKRLLCGILEAQVRSLRRKNKFVVVAVVGSIGKTSTKVAIAEVLSSSKRVCYQLGNYNDRLTVPLVLFGQNEPAIYNVWAWLMILLRNQIKLQKPCNYEVAVLELGIDAPGQMPAFAYLKPDVLVVTGVSAEHLEYFKTLDVVAQEELSAMSFSEQSLLNIAQIPAEYMPGGNFVSYGTDQANYALTATSLADLQGQELVISHDQQELLRVKSRLLGAQGASTVLAAAAVGDMLALSPASLGSALAELQPVAGRLQLLPGIKQSTLIDDTYNASPVSVKAALDVLYATSAKQRLAILGSMNELGAASPALHQQVGDYCDPKQLSQVITVGQDAKNYLALAAMARGCTVVSFDSPYQAGQYVREQLKTGAVVLAKGSQNKVFTEEALLYILRDSADVSKLVRQSPYWLVRKKKQFGARPMDFLPPAA